MEHNTERVKDSTPTSTESKGMLGSVWSAAGAIAETVTHAVQGTIDAAYHTADRLTHDAEDVAHKIVDTASSVLDKTLHAAADSVLPQGMMKSETESTNADFESVLSSPTNDLMAAYKSEVTIKDQPVTSDIATKASSVIETVKQAVSDTVSSISAQASNAVSNVKEATGDATIESITQALNDTVAAITAKASEVVDSTKESTLKLQQMTLDTVNAVSATPKQSTTESGLELTMDVVAHLQRIADRTGDKILHETARKAHSACAKGLSEAPGVHLVRITPDQATELVNLAIMTQDHELADFARYCQSVAATTQTGIEPSPGKIQEELIKGRLELNRQGRVHTGPGYGAAFASVSRALPATAQSASVATATPAEASTSSGNQLTMDMVAHLQRIADRSGDAVLHETARRAHSACAKGLSDAPGVHLVVISPEQASELVNLAIRTQDHELANFARYCQSVAATNHLGIEPAPGKVNQEIEKGRAELQQQGRSHTGPGYGAAFASISRSNSEKNLSRSNSSTSIGKTSRSSSPANVPLVAVKSEENIEKGRLESLQQAKVAEKTNEQGEIKVQQVGLPSQ